jgi:hypothetical protein
MKFFICIYNTPSIPTAQSNIEMPNATTQTENVPSPIRIDIPVNTDTPTIEPSPSLGNWINRPLQNLSLSQPEPIRYYTTEFETEWYNSSYDDGYGYDDSELDYFGTPYDNESIEPCHTFN